jgi:hypothetical protein
MISVGVESELEKSANSNSTWTPLRVKATPLQLHSGLKNQLQLHSNSE